MKIEIKFVIQCNNFRTTSTYPLRWNAKLHFFLNNLSIQLNTNFKQKGINMMKMK